MQLAAGDRAIDQRPRRAQIGIIIILRERFEARLVVHVLTASGQQQDNETEW